MGAECALRDLGRGDTRHTGTPLPMGPGLGDWWREDEIVAVSMLLLNAGHEATVNVIAGGAATLAASQRVGLVLALS